MEIKRFRADWRHVVETEFDDAQYVGVKDFDRILAERDALQLRLNAVEEENDRLRALLREQPKILAEKIRREEEIRWHGSRGYHAGMLKAAQIVENSP